MALKLGSTDITTLKLGSADISQAYLGATPLLSSGYDFGNALEFDGVNDGLFYANNIPNVAANTEFTVSLWLKSETNSENGQFWLTDFSNKDYWFFYPTAVYFRLNGSSALQNIWNYSYTPNNATWTHYMLTRDSSNVINFYVNGVVQSKTTSNTNGYNFQIAHIGRRNNSTKHFKGVMDDFVFKSGYCASAQDGLDLYNSGAGVDPSTILTSPLCWWKFNETTGLVASDSSSTANYDMSLVNFANNPNQWVAH
jgi:hypothetical protein